MSAREELELEKLKAEIRNLSANTQKVYAEIRKIERELLFYPAVAIATAIGAVIAIVRLSA